MNLSRVSASSGLAYRAPLQSGEAGTAQTIAVMRRLVDQALSDSSFVRQAIEVVRGVPAHDELGEVHAIYSFVSRNIRYTKDPVTKEKLYPPVELLKIRAGDCDDLSMLIGALGLALGYPARLITLAANPQAPDEFSHVYPELEVPAGSNNWIALDAARVGAEFGAQPPHYFRKRAWSLMDSSYQDLQGMTRLRGLSGYPRARGLGDDIDWSSILTAGIQQIPQDIAAVNGQPTSLRNPYGTVSTGNPYGSYLTPYSPGYGIPQAGYSASVTSSSWLMPLLLLGGALLLARRS